MSVSTLVRKYFAAYESKDRKCVESLLADDFTFSSPLDDRLDRAAYFDRCWPQSARIASFDIEKLVDDGRDAFVRYRCTLDSGRTFRNTELMTFAGGRIRTIDVYFGSLPQRAAGTDGSAAASADGSRRYLCLVYHDVHALEALSTETLEAIVASCSAWVDGLRDSGRHVLSAGLQNVRTATTVRSRNGTLSTTDGPFAETKEHLGGFTLLAARDLNEAIQLASKLAWASGGSIEVRPILSSDDELSDPLDRRIAAAIRRVPHD